MKSNIDGIKWFGALIGLGLIIVLLIGHAKAADNEMKAKDNIVQSSDLEIERPYMD